MLFTQLVLWMLLVVLTVVLRNVESRGPGVIRVSCHPYYGCTERPEYFDSHYNYDYGGQDYFNHYPPNRRDFVDGYSPDHSIYMARAPHHWKNIFSGTFRHNRPSYARRPSYLSGNINRRVGVFPVHFTENHDDEPSFVTMSGADDSFEDEEVTEDPSFMSGNNDKKHSGEIEPTVTSFTNSDDDYELIFDRNPSSKNSFNSYDDSYDNSEPSAKIADTSYEDKYVYDTDPQTMSGHNNYDYETLYDTDPQTKRGYNNYDYETLYDTDPQPMSGYNSYDYETLYDPDPQTMSGYNSYDYETSYDTEPQAMSGYNSYDYKSLSDMDPKVMNSYNNYDFDSFESPDIVDVMSGSENSAEVKNISMKGKIKISNDSNVRFHSENTNAFKGLTLASDNFHSGISRPTHFNIRYLDKIPVRTNSDTKNSNKAKKGLHAVTMRNSLNSFTGNTPRASVTNRGKTINPTLINGYLRNGVHPVAMSALSQPNYRLLSSNRERFPPFFPNWGRYKTFARGTNRFNIAFAPQLFGAKVARPLFKPRSYATQRLNPFSIKATTATKNQPSLSDIMKQNSMNIFSQAKPAKSAVQFGASSVATKNNVFHNAASNSQNDAANKKKDTQNAISKPMTSNVQNSINGVTAKTAGLNKKISSVIPKAVQNSVQFVNVKSKSANSSPLRAFANNFDELSPEFIEQSKEDTGKLSTELDEQNKDTETPSPELNDDSKEDAESSELNKESEKDAEDTSVADNSEDNTEVTSDTGDDNVSENDLGSRSSLEIPDIALLQDHLTPSWLSGMNGPRGLLRPMNAARMHSVPRTRMLSKAMRMPRSGKLMKYPIGFRMRKPRSELKSSNIMKPAMANWRTSRLQIGKSPAYLARDMSRKLDNVEGHPIFFGAATK